MRTNPPLAPVVPTAIVESNGASTHYNVANTGQLALSMSDAHVRGVLDALPTLANRAKIGPRPFPHPFPARMPLEVARAVIEGMSREGAMVLDPMIGSGTTSVAARVLHRPSIGFDIDPLAVILAAARCRPPPAPVFEDTAARVGECAEDGLCRLDVSPSLSTHEAAFLNRWFPRDGQLRLSALVNAILAESDVCVRATLIALFSSMIVTKQGGVTFALDVSRTRAHYSADKTPADPFVEWKRRARAFHRYADQSLLDSVPTDCLLARADARALPLPRATADLVLTSPPYLHAIDYMRASRFSLVWLGYTLSVLRDIRRETIGSERAINDGSLPKHLEEELTDSPTPARRKPMLRRYLRDLLTALQETRRCTKPGGIAVYVVGPSILSRRRYDGGDVLAQLARSVGWRVIGHTRRDFAANRRSLPPPHRNHRSQAINKRMSCEFYVALRNPE